jgi:hypothetical protein
MGPFNEFRSMTGGGAGYSVVTGAELAAAEIVAGVK